MPNDAKTAPGGVQTLWNSDRAAEKTDGELLHQFLSETDDRAEGAFATLVERHGPIVHRVCRDILGNRDQAQDAAQAVFLVLARKARSIRKPESLGPWLHGVSLRVARRSRVEAARQRAAERRKVEIMDQRGHADSGPETIDYADLHDEIDRLPEKYRQPIVLCYMQGLTQPQAAQKLGWPLGTVQIRLHRGRERLRSRLSRASVGLIAMPGSELTSALSLTASVLEREWTETTARAAVRFAAGKATVGLVAPSVTGLASSVLSAMLLDSLKILTVFVIATLLAATGLALAGARRINIQTGRLPAEPKKVIAAQQLSREAAPKGTVRNTRGGTASQKTQSVPRVVPVEEKTVSAAGAAKLEEVAPGPAPGQHKTTADQVAPSNSPPISSVRSRTLALAGTSPETSRQLGRELFERVWVKDDPRGHGGDGLGPVFNGQSCVACHNLGGPGGAGAIDRNIEIVTTTDGLNNFNYMGFSYSFSMDLREPESSSIAWAEIPKVRHSASLRSIGDSSAAIHAGFQDAQSAVLHRFGTDPTYNAWRESVPGRHGSILGAQLRAESAATVRIGSD